MVTPSNAPNPPLAQDVVEKAAYPDSYPQWEWVPNPYPVGAVDDYQFVTVQAIVKNSFLDGWNGIDQPTVYDFDQYIILWEITDAGIVELDREKIATSQITVGTGGATGASNGNGTCFFGADSDGWIIRAANKTLDITKIIVDIQGIYFTTTYISQDGEMFATAITENMSTNYFAIFDSQGLWQRTVTNPFWYDAEPLGFPSDNRVVIFEWATFDYVTATIKLIDMDRNELDSISIDAEVFLHEYYFLPCGPNGVAYISFGASPRSDDYGLKDTVYYRKLDCTNDELTWVTDEQVIRIDWNQNPDEAVARPLVSSWRGQLFVTPQIMSLPT